MGQPTVGSNPTLSATIQLIACAVGCIFLTWCLQEGETVAYRWVSREEFLSLREEELVTKRMQGFLPELRG